MPASRATTGAEPSLSCIEATPSVALTLTGNPALVLAEPWSELPTPPLPPLPPPKLLSAATNAAAATDATLEWGWIAGLAPCGEASQPVVAAAIELLATLPLLLTRPIDDGGWEAVAAVAAVAREASAAEERRVFGGRADLVCRKEIWTGTVGSRFADPALVEAVAGRPLVLLPFGGTAG